MHQDLFIELTRFLLTEVGSLFAWVAKTFEQSVFPKENISWTVAVLVSVSLCDDSSCVVAKFPQYCLHFLQLYFRTIHPLAGVHLTNWQCWLQVLLLEVSQVILSTHYPLWLTIYSLQFGVHFTNLHAVKPFDWPFRLVKPFDWPFRLVKPFDWPFRLVKPFDWPFRLVKPFDWPFRTKLVVQLDG